MQATQRDHSRRTATLDPHDYTVAWIAPLEIEAQAATPRTVSTALPAGQKYGTGSAEALASQVKKFFPNPWFGLLVGVAAGLSDLFRTPPRDIRLGDVLVGLPEGESAGLVAYDLGKETEDGFEPLRRGHALATTEPIIRSAIGSIKFKAPYNAEEFLPFYETIRDKEHATGTFADPGQDCDQLYLRTTTEQNKWPTAPDDQTQDVLERDELRDKYGVIGVEMEAAGTMSRIPVGVIRGVCDYGDKYKNKEWQPYAAAMAASYVQAVLDVILPHDSDQPNTPSFRFGHGVVPGQSKEWLRKVSTRIEAGRWLMVVDNADDQELVFGSGEGPGIEDFLPRSDHGLILLTTRSRQVAVEFAQADIEQMSREEATHLLKKSLPQKQMLQALIPELLDYLTYLPLAIT
ncbi:hypothetical protein BKA67DRAFT_660029 [Truncatella angustata]|uniref:Uncharacterized protein n=1 Tax=Truncatella angustata TaxID=152316 RepID=A0A9P8ZXW6_9PEZI|nr:uncharacterized protein BKA67DRAFT_660029 [Truncatella angustata]KAH6653404.1 hypothetical protein BKA67DRAFT_660029 [Truncatella angustata]